MRAPSPYLRPGRGRGRARGGSRRRTQRTPSGPHPPRRPHHVARTLSPYPRPGRARGGRRNGEVLLARFRRRPLSHSPLAASPFATRRPSPAA
ncbi:hypothetical protein DIZ27_01730 [Streptomyces sp. NWU339]|nr:hypothetical protein DIZ27_01730 [Streptomyces sp. NWU339]